MQKRKITWQAEEEKHVSPQKTQHQQTQAQIKTVTDNVLLPIFNYVGAVVFML